MNPSSVSVPTYTVRLYMAGDLDAAKSFLRRECYDNGLCVTVERTTFIYTAGTEEGLVVGFVNYPRFPCEPVVLWSRAIDIAKRMIPDLCQSSALLVASDKTEWITLRD